MASVSKSFTATGNGTSILVRKGGFLNYSVSGTFVATVYLEKSDDGGQTWALQVSKAAAATGKVFNSGVSDALYRFRCHAFTSGTCVTVINDVLVGKKRLLPAAIGKVGATAGFVVDGTTDVSLATCPASQTASTLVVPVVGLKVGDMISGFHLVGQVESAGNAVTVDAELRVMTAAAADVGDASVASITQISLDADAILSASNSLKEGLNQYVKEDENYYLLITATTGASTDIALQAVALNVVEA